MAFKRDYTAFKHAPWGGDTDEVWIDIYGEDLSAAAFAWVFADPADLSAKITLATAAAGSQGVSASYDAAAPHPTSGAIVGKTRILPQIDETTLEALTYSGVADLVLLHTLYVKPSGKSQYVECDGNLTIRQGAPD